MKIHKRIPNSLSVGFRRSELHYTSFEFPGGEIGIKLHAKNYRYQADEGDQTIVARLTSPRDILELVMVRDALSRFDPAPIHLVMPYVPYARQDRVCVPGEAFALKAFANVINGLDFQSVRVFDPHSEVTGAVFDRLKIVSQSEIIQRFDAFAKEATGSTFVSPDAGSNKKTSELASYFEHNNFIRADKLRDLSTGEIKETVIYQQNLEERDVVIADDICDGGRTFIALAKALKAKGAGKVALYVTHGIFSKGTKALLRDSDGKPLIDTIYTTNSFYDVWPMDTADHLASVLDLDATFDF